MRRIILFIIIGCVLGMSGCSKEEAEEKATIVKQANAQVEEEAYDCSTFFLKIPKKWIIHGSAGTNTLVGHTVNEKFNPGENTFWDLKVTSYINDEKPGEDFVKNMAQTIADRKHGKYAGEIQFKGITLHEVVYRAGAFIQKEYFGISEVREEEEHYKYYNIDFTLKNCPDDFRKNAMKILDGITFNFTFDF